MKIYRIGQTLAALEQMPETGEGTLVLLTSEELDKCTSLPGLEGTLHHTPLARDARGCKGEWRRGCLCGTVTTPRHTRTGNPIAFGYLLTGTQVVLCDDSGAAHTLVQRLVREKRNVQGSAGRFFYEFFTLLMAKDPRHLESLEDRLVELEEGVMEGSLEHFNHPMNDLRKEVLGWMRYYGQLNNMFRALEEDPDGLFPLGEARLLRLLGQRTARLREEAQLLREYCLQVRELFQAEIDIRQNRIMKILTIVTTIFLPLSLVAGWYGMNFVGMPELGWKYGYPAVIIVSVLVVLISLWIMKKKKFW